MSDAAIVVTLMTRPELQPVLSTARLETSLFSVRLSDADSVDPERSCPFYSIITLFSISDLSDMSLNIYRAQNNRPTLQALYA